MPRKRSRSGTGRDKLGWGGVGGVLFTRATIHGILRYLLTNIRELSWEIFFNHFTTLSLLLSFGKSSYSPVPSVLPWMSIGRVGIPIKCMRLMSSLFLKDAATKLGHI